MSSQELYEIARERVDARSRRTKLWALDVGGMLLWLAVIALVGDTALGPIAGAVFLAWLAVLSVHTIMLAATRHRADDIEQEVARLRDAIYDEKPKRVQLSDEGELIEPGDWDEVDAKRSRHS
jgi:hypothetical protein